MAGFLFSPSAGTTLAVTIANSVTTISGCEAIPEFGAEKGTSDTTAINDAAKSFGADLPDYGEITLSGIWDSTDTAQAHLMTSAASAQTVDVFTATFAKKSGGTNAAVAVFNGLVLSFRVSATKNNAQKFQSKIKLTGAVSFTAAT